MLTWLASGERRVLVDAAVLGPTWGGWLAASDGHVLGPLDIVRRANGHDVALPVCTMRAEDHLADRRERRVPLTAGEAVTLGVSVLRGCAEILSRPETTGEWWLTEDGRPLLATDASAAPAGAASAALLGVLAEAAPGSAWQTALDALSHPRLSSIELARAEDALFRLAAPQPLAMAVTGPRSARDLTNLGPALLSSGNPERTRPALWSSLARHVDADLADVVSRATTAVWRRTRMPRTRRTPWLIGVGAASVVLVAGLLWPVPGEGTATAGAPVHSSAPAIAAMPTSDAEPASTDPNEQPATTDLVAIAQTLLDRRIGCDGEASCRADLQLDPATPVGSGAIDRTRAERAVTLLDDYGGVAVLRVDAVDGAGTGQLMVLARRSDEWLLRDVHDIAQQP